MIPIIYEWINYAFEWIIFLYSAEFRFLFVGMLKNR